MPPTLPIEVAEHAIDFLHNDIHTLAACALASRVLLPTARLHMFYILHVPVQTHPTHPRMQALLEILESNAAIAPLVQFLALRGVPMPHARYQIRERWDDPAGTLRLWERFPNLRILAFTFFKFNMGLHQLLPLAYSLPHLEEIIVLGARAILPGEFSARPPYRDSLIAFTPPPKLKRLSIVGGNISWPFLEDLAKLLLEPSMRAPLDTLNLDCIRNSSNFEYATLDYTETLPSQSWAPVIASLAPTLRDCTLGILATECYPTNIANLYDSLTQCTHLRSLSVKCSVEINPLQDSGYCPFIFLGMLVDLLSSGPRSPFLELEDLEIVWVHALEPIPPGCQDACEKLARALEDRARHARLVRLTIGTRRTPEMSTAQREEAAAQEPVVRSWFERAALGGLKLRVDLWML